MNKEKILWGIAVIALVLGVFSVASRPQILDLAVDGQLGAVGNLLAEQYIPYVLYNGGYNSAKDLTISGATTLSGTNTFSGGTTISGVATSTNKFVANGGLICSKVNATSSALTTDPMGENELVDSSGEPYCGMIFEKTGALATSTLTFTATSSLTELLPNKGDRMQWCYSNATTTSGYGSILAEGTGWTFLTASSTATHTTGAMNISGTVSRTVLGGTTMCGTMIRNFNSDMTLIIVPSAHAE